MPPAKAPEISRGEAEQQVRALFHMLGLPQPTGGRLARLITEIASGNRSLENMRNDLVRHIANTQYGGDVLKTWKKIVRQMFVRAGDPNPGTANESANARVHRIANQIRNGELTMTNFGQAIGFPEFKGKPKRDHQGGKDDDPAKDDPDKPDKDKGKEPDAPDEQKARQKFLNTLKDQFPWLDDMGLDQQILKWIQEDPGLAQNPLELVVKIRQTKQWKTRFKGFFDKNGNKRFQNEGAYLQTEQNYLAVKQDYNLGSLSPDDYADLIEQGIPPEELAKRADMFNTIKRGSKALRAAFFVYAGIDVSNQDLYKAFINGEEGFEGLKKKYQEGVANFDGSLKTYLKRTGEFSKKEAAKIIARMEKQGMNVGNLSQATKDQVTKLTDAMYAMGKGGDAQDQNLMTLDELEAAMELALVGQAAVGAGFELPSKRRLQQWIDLGISQAQAHQGYQQAAGAQDMLGILSGRHGGPKVSQYNLEEAFVEGNQQVMNKFQRLYAQEEALGAEEGGFQTQQTESGRLVQTGRRSPGQQY